MSRQAWRCDSVCLCGTRACLVRSSVTGSQRAGEAGGPGGEAPKLRPKVCRQFMASGTCSYGERCQFSHNPEDNPRGAGTRARPWSLPLRPQMKSSTACQGSQRVWIFPSTGHTHRLAACTPRSHSECHYARWGRPAKRRRRCHLKRHNARATGSAGHAQRGAGAAAAARPAPAARAAAARAPRQRRAGRAGERTVRRAGPRRCVPNLPGKERPIGARWSRRVHCSQSHYQADLPGSTW